MPMHLTKLFMLFIKVEITIIAQVYGTKILNKS